MAIITEASHALLHALPPRKVPPKYDPPIRRIAAKKAEEQAAEAS